MKNWKNNDYRRFVKKVKHVHFIMRSSLATLENSVNDFADDNPEYKILGIRLSVENEKAYIAVITYLCNAPEEEMEETALYGEGVMTDMEDYFEYSEEDEHID